MQLNPKDLAIVLFGKEIPLSSNGVGDDASCSDTSSVDKEDRDKELEEETENNNKKKKKRFYAEAAEETTQQSSGVDTSPDYVTLDVPFVDEEETAKPKSSKTVKKPEKILPCPRCNSTDTKFCYYNNYNVNQPRHFCKSCKRYWTAGGTMRTMPVGAGRRKNKCSSSHYRHVTISDPLQASQIDTAANSIPHPGFKHRDGIVLKFGGVNPPIRDLTASILNGTNEKVLNGMMNRLHIPKSEKRHFSNSNGENYDDCSSNSTVSALSSNNGGTANMNFHPQIPSIPAIPLPYPWNYPAILPPPTLCTLGFGMPFNPAAFLNCSFLSNCNLPSLVPSNSVPDSPTLDKRARDGEVLDSQNPTKRRNASILVPKTLRVDNPNEAAKSTIWSTLGIKNYSLCREGFDCISPALVSNPAVLSRSLNFIESTLT